MLLLAASAMCSLVATQLPADAKAGRKPHAATTTTTAPPMRTALLMDVHAEPADVRCDWNGCEQATTMIARLSAESDSGPGIADRDILMTFGNGTSCTATTDSIGYAQCTAWGTPDTSAFGTFAGDAAYEPSTATWHMTQDWDRGL
jgi:hypothetical protein